MTTPSPLHVFAGSRRVGRLLEDEAGRLGFQYGDDWLAQPDAFGISVSLPLRSDPYDSAVAHSFFANLLPEGLVRQRLCRRLGISPDNDAALLRAIGGDCAGALSIVARTDVARVNPDEHYELIDPQQLRAWADGDGAVLAMLSGSSSIRLSLAGAQDKLPVFVDVDGALYVPLGSSPSTHLLKFPVADFKHLPENEAFTTEFARTLGLDAVKVTLLATERNYVALIARYDRTTLGGPILRLHQEDLCQALGVSAARKYEQEGGPSLSQVAALLTEHSARPAVDLAALVQWTVFCLLANSDGHGKNLSLLYSPPRGIRLSPFYDLVCTRAYRGVDRHLAMRVGGSADPGVIGRKHFAGLAHELRMRPRYVVELVEDLLARAPAALDTTVATFENVHGELPFSAPIVKALRKQIRRSTDLMRQRPSTSG